MRISDWSSDVCSSDLRQRRREAAAAARAAGKAGEEEVLATDCFCFSTPATSPTNEQLRIMSKANQWIVGITPVAPAAEPDAGNVLAALLEAGAQNPRLASNETRKQRQDSDQCAARLDSKKRSSK